MPDLSPPELHIDIYFHKMFGERGLLTRSVCNKDTWQRNLYSQNVGFYSYQHGLYYIPHNNQIIAFERINSHAYCQHI